MKDKASPGRSLRPACDYKNKQRGDGRGRPIMAKKKSPAHLQKTGNSKLRPNPELTEKQQKALGAYIAKGSVLDRPEGVTGTSVFDPVLCELIYRWFSPPKGKILDPFAGGSVRGIVAGYLGYEYIGVELRLEQIEANIKQLNIIPNPNLVKWILGDAKDIKTLAIGEYDLIFSCPPYYDLEIYSDLKGELSAIKSYVEFIDIYRQIIRDCVSMLRDNRFACFVVGDIRDKQGYYRNFVSDTISAFRDGGMKLYNEAILVTAVGSLPIRINKPFQGYRKLGKTHQNVLIFYKGNIKKIKEFGEVEVVDINNRGKNIAH